MLVRIQFIIFLILTFIVLLHPQEREGFTGGTISGKVFDANTGHSIEYANIVVLSKNDSSVITGTVSDAEGNFIINRVPPGNYFVDVRFIGFSDKRFDVSINRNNLNINLGEIYLDPAAINLGDVVVEGERSPVTYQLDKKVIDVSQMQTVISGNAADVLENVPSVTVDIEGNVSLRGSGNFTVLIDGRPSIIDAQDALQQIPASSIKSIEIITNPSAKYDPEGTAGIINIILKKNQNLGMSGIMNANAGLNDKYGGDFLFEYKSEGINTTFGIDYNRRFSPGESREEQRFTLNNNTSFLNSTGDREWGRISFGLRGGVEFILGENNILSFGGRYGSRVNLGNSFQNYIEWSEQLPQQLSYTSIGDRERSGDHYALNMNYFHRFSPDGHELKGELVYGYDNSDESTITSEFNNGIQTSGKKTTELGPSTEIEGKLDYTLPLGENRKFEAGAEGQAEISEESTSFSEYNTNAGVFLLEPQFSNTTKYNERELAVYSLFADQFGNFGLQGGVRGEYTYRTIEVTRLNQEFNIDRWDFFPSVHSSYKFAEGQQMMASYTRRIDRPGGWELEPFDTWMDANNVRRGNPALEPEYIDSYEFGFQTFIGKAVLSSEIYYRITHNKIDRVQSIYSEDDSLKNVTLHTTENIGKDYSLGSELMLIFDPVEFWNINLMGNLYNYRIKGVLFSEPFSRESFNWSSRFNNVFKVSKTTTLQFNVNYNSPTVSSQGTREGFFTSDVAVKQDFFERKLSLTVQVRDIFSTAKYEFTSQGADFYRYNYFTRESPMVMLNLRYNFNNFKQEKDGERPNGQFEEGEEF
ncbi:MAG: outer membrane beta-barrel family protein [Ignavibacteria bacterium]|nr:outer membrane beta-barrel family protein [Ignavibacteria bacterium]